MEDVGIGRKGVLLVVWGFMFVALVAPYAPDTALGILAKGSVLWAAFYPFVVTTGFVTERRYWLALPVLLGTVEFLHLVGAGLPYKAELTAAALLLVVVMNGWYLMARRNKRRQAGTKRSSI